MLPFCVPILYQITSKTKRVVGLKSKLTSESVRVGGLKRTLPNSGFLKIFEDPYWGTLGLD